MQAGGSADEAASSGKVQGRFREGSGAACKRVGARAANGQLVVHVIVSPQPDQRLVCNNSSFHGARERVGGGLGRGR